MSCEKKNFKRLKRDLPPIRWQDEDLCDDREDASKMMQYLKRICVEFEQMEEKIQSQFFLQRKNDRKKGKCKDSFSPLGKTWKLYHWIEKKKAVMKSLLGRICFCPHFWTTARLCPFVLKQNFVSKTKFCLRKYCFSTDFLKQTCRDSWVRHDLETKLNEILFWNKISFEKTYLQHNLLEDIFQR